MKKSRIITYITTFTAMAATAGVLAGCGGGGSTPAETTTQAQTEAATTVATETTTATAAEKTGALKVTDMMGREVEIPADADSFACIGAGALRYYMYVADKENLAGIEEVETTWLPEGRPYSLALGDVSGLKSIGQGGPQGSANADALIAAEPDVIISMYNTDPDGADKLQEQTNIPVVVFDYDDAIFSDVTYDSIELMGVVTGNEERASEVNDYLKGLESDLKKRTEEAPETPETYLGAINYKGTKGISSTAGEYMPFDVLGVNNVVKKEGVTGTQTDIDRELLIDLNPEYIFLDAAGLSNVEQDFSENPDYYDYLQAFKNDNVYLQMPFKNYYNNIEVSAANAYYIGTVLYPEQFKDVDAGEKFDEITDKMLGIKCYDNFVETYGGFEKVKLGE